MNKVQEFIYAQSGFASTKTWASYPIHHAKPVESFRPSASRPAWGFVLTTGFLPSVEFNKPVLPSPFLGFFPNLELLWLKQRLLIQPGPSHPAWVFFQLWLLLSFGTCPT